MQVFHKYLEANGLESFIYGCKNFSGFNSIFHIHQFEKPVGYGNPAYNLLKSLGQVST